MKVRRIRHQAQGRIATILRIRAEVRATLRRWREGRVSRMESLRAAFARGHELALAAQRSRMLATKE